MGDLVRVRSEDVVSVVVLPTDRRAEPDELPGDVPDLGETCCVPVVLLRTPALARGVARWVEAADVALAEDFLRAAEAVEVGMWVQSPGKRSGFWLRVGAVVRDGPDSPVILCLDLCCCNRVELPLKPGQKVFALDEQPTLAQAARGPASEPSE